MAQSVEQLTVNQWVTGSSPVTPAINLLPVLMENRLVSVNALLINMLVWLNGRAADL